MACHHTTCARQQVDLCSLRSRVRASLFRLYRQRGGTSRYFNDHFHSKYPFKESLFQRTKVRPGLNVFDEKGNELDWDYEHVCGTTHRNNGPTKPFSGHSLLRQPRLGGKESGGGGWKRHSRGNPTGRDRNCGNQDPFARTRDQEVPAGFQGFIR